MELFYQLLWMDLLGFHLNGIYTLDTDRTQDIHDVVGLFLGIATCQPDLIENPSIPQLFPRDGGGESLLPQLIAQLFRLVSYQEGPGLDYKVR